MTEEELNKLNAVADLIVKAEKEMNIKHLRDEIYSKGAGFRERGYYYRPAYKELVFDHEECKYVYKNVLEELIFSDYDDFGTHHQTKIKLPKENMTKQELLEFCKKREKRIMKVHLGETE